MTKFFKKILIYLNRPFAQSGSQASFSMIECMFAIGLLVIILLEVSNVQISSIRFSDFSRKSSKATYLLKRVMSQVEYHWQNKDFTELKTNLTAQKFEDLNKNEDDSDYLYDVVIEEYKIPLIKIIAGSMLGGGDESGGDSGMSATIEALLKQYIDGPLLMLASVKVYWQEGAKTISFDTQLILPNQRKVSEVIQTLGAASGAARPPRNTGGNNAGQATGGSNPDG